MNSENATVVGNDEDGWNVEYRDRGATGCLLRVGCRDKEDAEELARQLNDASWVEVDAKGRL